MIFQSAITYKGNSSFSFNSQEEADRRAYVLDCNGCVACTNCIDCTDCKECIACIACSDLCPHSWQVRTNKDSDDVVFMI